MLLPGEIAFIKAEIKRLERLVRNAMTAASRSGLTCDRRTEKES
jgi:hypothetical protein